jgi:hypothetical protein
MNRSMAHEVDLNRWLVWTRNQLPDNRYPRVKLFSADAHLVAEMDNRERLLRNPDMEQFYRAVIAKVCDGTDYCGIVYLMYWLNEAGNEIPLYVGKAERYGRNGGISLNLTNKSFFGRWGYPSFYHIGDLSKSVHQLTATGISVGRHSDWALKLFEDPSRRRLRRQVYFWASPWSHSGTCPCGIPVNVAALENCLIRYARRFFQDDNLNTAQGGDFCCCPLARRMTNSDLPRNTS